MTVINMRKALLVVDGGKRIFIGKNLVTNKTRKNPAGFVDGVPVMGFWKAVRMGLVKMNVRMIGWNPDFDMPRFRAKIV